ncbi:pre-mRNA cleavage complex 2 protein Pcf11 isoform X2 [Drosophila tropicalis]|uniref:pre-mRNA cleavage complex 2 protein Pcf11 isoform X2 n=1 Tax=Drosophila tropicalis TaxID=46794 RepID=UPI0035AC0B0B
MDQLFQSYRDDERRIGEEYLSSLQDLNCNSKPLINMLTMLAEENINYARVIVRVVEYYISQVPPEFKLPILYLIDSIIKNVKSSYVQLFGQCIVNIFLTAFESVQHSQSQVLEKVRERMYALRQTWNEVFPPSKLYELDVKVKRLDNNWPITAKQPTTKIHVNPAIHVNPNFLKTGMVTVPTLPSDMEEILQAKTRELLELKKRKLELELEQTKKHLEEQERQLNQATDAIQGPTNPILMPAPTPPTTMRPPPVMEAPSSGSGGIRNARPTGSGAVPSLPGPQQQQASAVKPKVHPVNPALLNSVRHRDPRLARQMQSQNGPMAAPLRSDPRLEAKASSSSSQKSSRSRSKSPNRNSGGSRSSKSSSSPHRGSSSSSNSSRKRSESKSSTASSSSSGSDSRHKGSPTKRSSKHSTSKELSSDRYARNGSPSTATSKRKSNSPASSPSKSKRNASQKASSSGLRSKSSTSSSTRSRSRSPLFVDVDMRRSPEKLKVPSASPSSSIAAASTIPNTATSIKAIIVNDLEKPYLSTAATATPLSLLIPASSSVKQSSPSPVPSSFSSSAAGASSTTTATTTTSGSSSLSRSGNVSSDVINNLLPVSTPGGGPGEKRPAEPAVSEILDDDELPPQQKRSKSAKLDTLFGSEDVDLRRVIPSATLAGPVIVLEDDSMDNCDTNKLATSKVVSPPKKATLEELRARVSKSVRESQKMADKDKPKEHPVAQRLKQLAELRNSDDSQEAHDEKVRTILSQAQEIFQNNGMNQEQYKDLVQKVVAINESGKLKEASRRQRGSKDMDVVVDVERNAAKEAVLRKRIPKLKGNENHLHREVGSPRSEGSPRYDEQSTAASAETTSSKRVERPPLNNKRERENKRRKPSKWGDQVADPVAAQRAAWQLANNNNNVNKRGGPNGNGGGPPQSNFRGMPWQQPPPAMVMGVMQPHPTHTPSMIPMPPVPPPAPNLGITKAINSFDNPMADVVRSITIDGGSKEIRFYNQVAVIFMDGDEPHEIGFQHGQRVILIDNNDPLPLNFNDEYKPFQLDGQLHRIRFGFPSRELYIDDHWYEIYFGGPAVSLPIGNKLHVLKAEGPPPNVDIGRIRRDLVVGKINMIVDAHTIIPLFLDARQQNFQLGAEQHSLQFVDSFQYALMDGQLQRIEYGGLPKGIKLNGGRSCFIRFGTLPKGVVAGRTHVADMVYIKTDAPAEPPQPPPLIVKPTPPPPTAPIAPSIGVVAPVLDVASTISAPAVTLPAAAAALSNLNIDELFQKLVSSGIIGGGAAVPAAATVPAGSVAGAGAPASASSAAAVVPGNAAAPADESSAVSPVEPIQRIELNKPETIKTRQTAVVATLYLGMQCSSCGVRFPPEQTIKYSQHLDWHFRQNRRDRDTNRKATSRRWYYDLNDWRQYEEIEDMEEREKNFLEAQGSGGTTADAFDDLSQQRSMDSPVPTCPAGADDVDRCCDMCHEKFEQFYNEELEEWHLRSAIRVEDKIYHPLCYEDYKTSLNPPSKNEDEAKAASKKDLDMNNSDDNAMDILIKVEDLDDDDEDGNAKHSFDDDDDDVIVLPNEEPSVTEIVDDDDDEYVPANVTRLEMGGVNDESSQEKPASLEVVAEVVKGAEVENEKQVNNKHSDNDDESDVEIKEPHIPFTDLDTYVEKPLLNVKIKEEPKDDDEEEEDEDDGFEDVGTVVPLLPLPLDEISINSSETQTQTIGSSASPATLERPASVASLGDEDVENGKEKTLEETEPESTHNLSAAGPAPALPLASIVNKIKINITKNSNSNSHNSASSNTTATTTATTATTSAGSGTVDVVSAISVIGGQSASDPAATAASSQHQQQASAIQTISTIPVLCGGNTFAPKITSSSSSSGVISSISVIGSYVTSSSNSNHNPTSGLTSSSVPSTVVTTPAPVAASTTASATPAVVEASADPEPIIELKPALRNVTLKKTKTVQNGTETSGLCSIM